MSSVAGADDRRLAHLAADHRGVRGHAAGGGEDALRHEHAVDVVGHGLAADQDDRLALLVHSTAWSAVNTTWPLAAPGEAGSPLVATGIFFHSSGSKPGASSWISDFGIDQQHRFLRRDQPLVHQVGGDHHRGVAGALAAARLQHEQALVLDRELEVLDVLVVLLEPRGDVAQLLVGLRHHLLELADRLRRADAGDDVLALGVDQELAVELLACRWPGCA